MSERYLRLMPGDPLPQLNDFSPFKAVLVIEADVKPEWQAKVSRWLADAGCRYMMAWGIACSSWDDSVDLANMEQFDCSAIPEEEFIVTTWHDDELLDEVLWFARMGAQHPTLDLQNVLVLHVGTNDREEEIATLFAAA